MKIQTILTDKDGETLMKREAENFEIAEQNLESLKKEWADIESAVSYGTKEGWIDGDSMTDKEMVDYYYRLDSQ